MHAARSGSWNALLLRFPYGKHRHAFKKSALPRRSIGAFIAEKEWADQNNEPFFFQKFCFECRFFKDIFVNEC